MLIRYKKNFEKIAMGLLSLMPEEKDVKKLQDTIHNYEKNSEWQLFLWKEEDVLGAIGIKIDNHIDVVIQHVSVTPSHRDLGIGTTMIHEVKKMYQDKYSVCPNEQTLEFYKRCDSIDD